MVSCSCFWGGLVGSRNLSTSTSGSAPEARAIHLSNSAKFSGRTNGSFTSETVMRDAAYRGSFTKHWRSARPSTTSCEHLSRVLRPGAYCAIVIGASRKYPELTKAVIELFGSYLRLVWGPVRRVPTRRRVSEKSGIEPIESVCLFVK